MTTKREPCPTCRDKGNDKSGNNLVSFDNSSKHCYSCGHHVSAEGGISHAVMMPPNRAMPETGIQTRHITSKVCHKYGVVNALLDETEYVGNGRHRYKLSSKVLYPYYDIENAELVGWKQIDYSRAKKDSGRFLWFGDSKRAIVYGANIMSASASNIIICEGENDTLSAAQMLSSSEYTVIGISGVGMVDKLKRALSVIRKYRKIYVCMDNDEAGHEAAKRLVDILPAGKTYTVQLPGDVNDVNDMLMAGRASEFVRCIRDAKQIQPKGIVEVEDLRERLKSYLGKRDGLKGVKSGIPALDFATGGLVPGKLMTFVGGTGCGKSTIAENIAVNAALEGHHSFIMSLEMPDTQVAARMVQTILRQPVASDPEFDVNELNQEEYERAINVVLEHVHFYEHVGSLSVDTIIDVMQFSVDCFDTKLIVLDNFTSASDSLEWKDLDKLAQRVKNEVALARGVAVVAVSHISRDGNNEEEIPALKHLRGGNGVAQQSDIVIGVGRKRDSKVINCKTIKTDRMTGRYIEFDLEYSEYKLVQVGWADVPTTIDDDDDEQEYEHQQPPLTQHQQDTTTDDTTTQQCLPATGGDEQHGQGDTLSVGVRGSSPRTDTDASGVRTGTTEVSTGEVLQARLSTPEWDTYRDKRAVYSGGQKKDEVYKGTKLRNRYTFGFPSRYWDNSEQRKDQTN